MGRKPPVGLLQEDDAYALERPGPGACGFDGHEHVDERLDAVVAELVQDAWRESVEPHARGPAKRAKDGSHVLA